MAKKATPPSAPRPSATPSSTDRPPFLRWDAIPATGAKLTVTGDIFTHNSQYGQQILLRVQSASGRLYTWGIKVGSPTHIALTTQLVKMVAHADPVLPVRVNSFTNSAGDAIKFIEIIEPSKDQPRVSQASDDAKDDIPF